MAYMPYRQLLIWGPCLLESVGAWYSIPSKWYSIGTQLMKIGK